MCSGLVPILHRTSPAKPDQDFSGSNLPWNRLPCLQLFVRLGLKFHLRAGLLQVVEPNCRLVRHADLADSRAHDRASAVTAPAGSLPWTSVDVPVAKSLLRRAVPFVPSKLWLNVRK